MTEQWKQVPGHPRYEASSLGRIKSFMRYPDGKVLKPSGWTGNAVHIKYRLVKLRDTNKVYMWHRVICAAFIRPPRRHERVVFKDNNPDNLLPNNLEIVTQEEARQRARARTPGILPDHIVREIRRRLGAGEGQREIARTLGISAGSVHYISVGRNYRAIK